MIPYIFRDVAELTESFGFPAAPKVLATSATVNKNNALLLLSLLTFCATASSAETLKPNFLIIVTDDQGYADLSAFEHHASDVHTPNTDRLAARGVLFTEAYVSAPVCSPSRAGWTTGRHQVRWDPKSSFACGLPKTVPHIAEIMKENGYTTARFGKNDYGKGMHRRDVREYPLNHGYDEFLGFSAHGHDFFLLSKDIQKRTPDPKGHSAVVGPLMHNRGVKEFKDGYLTEIFTDAAIDFLRRHQRSGSRQDFRSEPLSAETLREFRYQNGNRETGS
ncbi:MAG: sulfatase-like hydrolase/transferase, partial [Fuerstiella sp.]